MKPIKFLEPEIAEKIETLTANFSDKNPIFKLVTLYNIFSTQDKTTLYNMLSIHDKSKPFDEQTAHEIRNIIENYPEQLLLHFATYDPQNTSHAAFVTPISEDFDCVTYIRKNKDLDPTAVASVLKRKDSDIEFDLTLVDTYELDIDKSKEPYIKSYLYGNPYDEEWEYVQKTNFSDIDDVIKNNE